MGVIILIVALFAFSSGLRGLVWQKFLSGLDAVIAISYNLVVDTGRFLAYQLGLEKRGLDLAPGVLSGFWGRRQLASIWLGWGGGLGVLLPGLLVLGVLALFRLRGVSQPVPSLDKQNIAQFKLVCRYLRQALWRNLMFDIERVWSTLVAIGLSLFLFQFVLSRYFYLSPQFVWGFGLIFIGYSYFVHIQFLLRYGSIYQEVIGAIEAKLCLKQGLTTLLGVRSSQTISRLYSFLLADVSRRIEKLNIPALFPHRVPQLTRHNFGSPLLALTALACLVSLAGHHLTPLASRQPDSAPQLAVSPATELDKTIKQEAEKLRLLSEELVSNPKLQGMGYVASALEELSDNLTALSKLDMEGEVSHRMYAYNPSIRVSPTDSSASNNSIYDDKPSEFTPAGVVSQAAGDNRRIMAKPEQNGIPPVGHQPEKEYSPDLISPPTKDSRSLYVEEIARELGRMSQKLVNAGPLTQNNAQTPQTPSAEDKPSEWPVSASVEDMLVEAQYLKQDTPTDTPAREEANQQQVEALRERQPDSQPNSLEISTGEAGSTLGENNPQLVGASMVDLSRETATFSPPSNVMVSPHELLGELPAEHRDWWLNEDQLETGQARPLSATDELTERVRVSALRLELLGETLLLVASPQDVALDANAREYLAPKLGASLLAVADPELIQNHLPELTSVLQDVRNPRNIDMITSELNRLGEELNSWQADNLFAGVQPQPPGDFSQQLNQGFVQNGGSSQANRETITISNISHDLERISSELINWGVQRRGSVLEGTSMMGNSLVLVESLARELGLPNLINSGRNQLQALADQLPQAGNPKEIEQIMGQMLELAQQVGNLTLQMADSRQLADNAPTGGDLPRETQLQGMNLPDANQQVGQQLRQNGELLLSLGTRLQPGLNSQVIKEISSDMLAAFNQLGGLTTASGSASSDLGQGSEDIPSLAQQLRGLAQELRSQANANNFSRYSFLLTQMANELGDLGLEQNGLQPSNYPDLERIVGELEQVSHQLSRQQGAAEGIPSAQIPGENLTPRSGLATMDDLRSKPQLANKLDGVSSRPDYALGCLDVLLDQRAAANTREVLRNIADKLRELRGTKIQDNSQQLEELGMELVSLSQKLASNLPPTGSSMARGNAPVPDTGSSIPQQSERQISGKLSLAQGLGHQLEDLTQQLLTSTQLGDRQDIALALMNISQQLQRLSQAPSNRLNPSKSTMVEQSAKFLHNVLLEHEERLQQLIEPLRANTDGRNLGQIGLQLAQLADEMSAMESEQMMLTEQAARAFNSVTKGLERLSQEILDGGSAQNYTLSDDTQRHNFQRAIKQRIEGLWQLNQGLIEGRDLNRLPELASEVAMLAEELKGLAPLLQQASGQQRRANSMSGKSLPLDGMVDALGQISHQLNSLQQVEDVMETDTGLKELLQELGNLLTKATKISSLETQVLEDQLKDSTLGPDLVADLTMLYGKLTKLNLSSGELTNSEIIEGVKQLEVQSDLLIEDSQLTKIAFRLNELATQLLGVDPAPDGYQPSPTESKRQQALNQLDQAIRQLRQYQSELETLYNARQGSKRVVAADGGRNNSSMKANEMNSLYLDQQEPNDTKVARETEITLESESISNAYSMEKNLYQQETLGRIIKRIENQRKLIDQVASAGRHAGQASTYEASPREGRLPQPHGLKVNRLALTPHEMLNPPKLGGIPRAEITPVTEKPVSYKDRDANLKTGFAELSIKAEELGKLGETDIPADKILPQQKAINGLGLSPKQGSDESVIHQPIPQHYKKMIQQIFVNT